MLVSYDLIGQLIEWVIFFKRSHTFHKGYRREGDIQKMSPAQNVGTYGSIGETNGGRCGILSNVVTTGDLQ